jgi:hypothetical protein
MVCTCASLQLVLEMVKNNILLKFEKPHITGELPNIDFSAIQCSKNLQMEFSNYYAVNIFAKQAELV